MAKYTMLELRLGISRVLLIFIMCTLLCHTAKAITKIYVLTNANTSVSRLMLSSENTYSISIKVKDSLSREKIIQLSTGMYSVINDTLLLKDTCNRLSLKLYQKKKSGDLVPLSGFPYMINNLFKYNETDSSNQVSYTLNNSDCNKGFPKIPVSSNEITPISIIGRYTQGTVYVSTTTMSGYELSFTLNHYYLFFYDQLISHGKWKVEEGIVHAVDDNLKCDFQFIYKDDLLTPLVFINSFPDLSFRKKNDFETLFIISDNSCSIYWY